MTDFEQAAQILSSTCQRGRLRPGRAAALEAAPRRSRRPCAPRTTGRKEPPAFIDTARLDEQHGPDPVRAVRWTVPEPTACSRAMA
jgi:hypothetical protein